GTDTINVLWDNIGVGKVQVELNYDADNICVVEKELNVVVDLNTGNNAFSANNINVYPNPFSSTTIVSYQLKTTSTVQIKVLDIVGKSVFQKVKEIQNAGAYEMPVKIENGNGLLLMEISV